MKNKLRVIVTALVGLLCPTGEAAAAPLYCMLTGMANNQPTTWTFAFPEFTQYGSVVGGVMYGWNATLNTVATGSVALNNGFPAYLRWTEGPGDNFAFVRHINVTLESNLKGTGKIIDTGVSGTFNANVSITNTACFPLNILF